MQKFVCKNIFVLVNVWKNLIFFKKKILKNNSNFKACVEIWMF